MMHLFALFWSVSSLFLLTATSVLGRQGQGQGFGKLPSRTPPVSMPPVSTPPPTSASTNVPSSINVTKEINVWKCVSGSEILSFDLSDYCSAWADTYTFTELQATNGFSLEYLNMLSQCQAAVQLVSLTYAETKGKGKVVVSKQVNVTHMNFNVNLELVTATLVLSLASSEINAAASTSAVAIAYTDLSALCASPDGQSLILCAGATAGSVQLATAAAASASSSWAGGIAGSTTTQSADVQVLGNTITKVKTNMIASAENFAWTTSSASALATAYSNIYLNNFIELCTQAKTNYCNSTFSETEPFCAMDDSTACQGALSYASGSGGASATFFAKSCATAAADLSLSMILKARVTAADYDVQLDKADYGEAVVEQNGHGKGHRDESRRRRRHYQRRRRQQQQQM